MPQKVPRKNNLHPSWTCFGRCFREKRIELNMSQLDLQKKSGVTRTTISSYEIQLTEPTLSKAKYLSKAMGITLEEMASWLNPADKDFR